MKSKGMIAMVAILLGTAYLFTKTASANNLNGIFEYTYPYNTDDLKENHFIEFKNKNGKIAGTYFGTSDDFDEAREGYEPGFFQSTMVDLLANGEAIKFKVKVIASDFYAKPVTPLFKNTKNPKWPNTVRSFEREYTGTVKNDTISLTSTGIEPRLFKKK